MDPSELVLESTKGFDAALPKLMADGLAGRWVVFRGSELTGDYASEDEAFRDAVKKFGRDGGFAVLLVAPREPTPISAIFQFA